ncbi:hypothetical protein EPN44_06650 [bacterium]|nr:MAG: hypothetical protein EPN44_06650 [bacterium]
MSVHGGTLVPLPGPEALQPNGAPFSAHGGIRLADQGVFAFVALAWHDRHKGVAAYALRVVNGTSETVLCRCFEIRGGEVPVEVYPMPLVAAPNGVMDTFVFVRTDHPDALSRFVVDVAGRGAALRVEAPAPAKRAPHVLALLGWGLSLLLLLAAAGAAVIASIPRLTVFEPPTSVVAGTPLEVPYAFGGVGSLQYDLATDDGRTIAADTVEARVGILRIALPNDGAHGSYRLRLRAVGPLGTDVRTASVAMLAPPQQANTLAKPGISSPDDATLIGELNVTPAPAQAGRDVHVNYVADATSGKIWLLDLSGKAWASAPYSSDGTSLLRIPAAAAGREMRVVLQVERGPQRAMSSVGIVVEPNNAAHPAATIAQSTPAQSPTTGEAAPPRQTMSAGIELSQSSVVAGQSVHVRITGPHSDALVTLTDARGQVIEQGDVSGQERGITLTAPAVNAPSAFYVVASITSGVSQASVVRKLVVTPAP